MSNFSAARSRATESASNSSYYSDDAKNRIASERTPLYLHAPIRTQGKFGFRWELTISEGSPTADQAVLTLPANAFRDDLFGDAALLAEIKRGPVGPLVLERSSYKNGAGWDLVELDTTPDELP